MAQALTSRTQRKKKEGADVFGFRSRKMEERREDDEESEDKGNKKRQKMSKVWEHFKLDIKANTVTCIHCKTALAYHNSTSSMLQHLHRRHPVYSESRGPERR